MMMMIVIPSDFFISLDLTLRALYETISSLLPFSAETNIAWAELQDLDNRFLEVQLEKNWE